MRLSKLRDEISNKLDAAKSLGDLSENSAYTVALEEYQFNETRIKKLQKLLAELEIAPEKHGDQAIDIGDKVEVRDLVTGKNLTYTIVGQGEGDPKLLQVSTDSLLGKALAGKKIGAKIKVKLPIGEKEFEIIKVE